MNNLLATKFYEVFQNLSDSESNKTALISGKERYSYAELDRAINLCASDLISMGVCKGDHVGLWSFNSANVVIAFFAIVRIGAVAVLGNYSMTFDEIAGLMKMTDVRYLVYGTVLAARNQPEIYSALASELQFTGEKLYDITSANRSFRDRLTEEPVQMDEIRRRMQEDRGDRDAYIIFTSGTTSQPKAVLNHQQGLLVNIRENVQNRRGIMGEKAVISLPLFHVFGLTMVLNYLQTRGTLYLTEKVGADSVVQAILQDDVTDIATVTAVYLQIIEHPEFSRISGKVHLLTTAGGLITPVQYMKLENAFQNAKLFNEYGQTESHGYITSCGSFDPIEKRAFTIGKPFHREEVRIFDSQKGILPDGELGEIIVKNKTVMNGYYKLPAEKQAVDADGWLHTGDIGMFDEDGYIRLAGRIKDIIIKSGENITPSEVEGAVTALPQVREAKVFGVPHPIYGESVECCVTLEEGCALNPDEAKQQLKQALSASKIPSHIFVFDAFPLAPSGKLDQRELRILLVRRMRELAITQGLQKGITAFELSVKNSVYNIIPVSMMLRATGETLGFSKSKREKIALAVEEFLNIRILETKNDVGDIRIRCIFREEWLSIAFSDSGENYYIEKNEDTSFCAKIILNVADNFYMRSSQTEPTWYYMDFLYEKDLDIQKYLLSHDRDSM